MSSKTKTVYRDYDQAASALAKEHHNAAPETSEIYLFPDPAKKEIRLVELDPTMESSGHVMEPTRFTAEQMPGIPFKVAVAVILPQESKVLTPPDGWCSWSEAKKLWPGPKPVNRLG